MSDATNNALFFEENETEQAAAPEAPLLPPRKRRRWLWLVVPLVALAAGGAGLVTWRAHAKPKVAYETVPVDRGRIVVQVTASGTVSALKTVQVGSQVSGRVIELNADFNDTVKKGQLLARLDPQLFKAAIEQSRASYAVARSNVAKAEAQLAQNQQQLARSKVLAEGKFLAQEEVDTQASSVAVAKAALTGARAQAQQSAASLHQAELNLEMASIYSPVDGVVISRSVDVGQTVAASLQAPTIFTIAEDLRKMQVEAHVAEGDVARLAAGTPVSFTVDAFPGRKFSGSLRQVRNAAATVQSVVTYDAVIDVDNAALELRPGMTANVSFMIAQRDNVLRIHNAALRFRPANTRTEGRTVFAVSGATVRPIPIRTGITDGSRTEVVSGELAEGTLLATDTIGDKPKATPASNRPAGAFGGGAAGPPNIGGGRRTGGAR
jgi:HlyD family secretion protein